jgi:hypothetical protein
LLYTGFRPLAAVPRFDLQALGVVLVRGSAGTARSTGSASSVSLATALSVLGHGASSCGRTRAAVAAGAAGGCAGRRISGVEITISDVGVYNLNAGGVLLNSVWVARVGSTSTTSSARAGGVSWVGRVEPKHVHCVIIPYRERENHAVGEGITHGSKTAILLEAIVVSEDRLLSIAVSVGDGVDSIHTCNVADRVFDHSAILDILAADLSELTRAGAIRSDELSDNGELLVGVDRHSWAVKGRVSLAVRVEVASILITNTLVTLVAVTAFGARATVLALDGADVGSIGC